MHLARFIAPTILLGVAACGGEPKLIPPHPAANGEEIRTLSVSGRVLDADSAQPKCPVRLHFDAVLTLVKLSGKLQYRWVRTNGDTSRLMELDIPPAAATGPVEVAVKADEWPDTARGQQLVFGDYVQILSPIPAGSFSTQVNVKCY